MSEKTLKTRIIHKHDIETNWLKSSLIPKKGELIIYDPDGTHVYPRMKIGDGITNVNALQFFTSGVHVGTEDPGVNSGMIWIDTNDVAIRSVEGVEF